MLQIFGSIMSILFVIY